eukprot:5834760-Prymnesium_polylepis.1
MGHPKATFTRMHWSTERCERLLVVEGQPRDAAEQSKVRDRWYGPAVQVECGLGCTVRLPSLLMKRPRLGSSISATA